MNTKFSLVQLDILREALKTDTATEVSLRYSKHWRMPVKTVLSRVNRLLKAESKKKEEKKDTRSLLNLEKLQFGVKAEKVYDSSGAIEVPVSISITSKQKQAFDLVKGIQTARARGDIGVSTAEELPLIESPIIKESPKVTITAGEISYKDFSRVELFQDHVIIYF